MPAALQFLRLCYLPMMIVCTIGCGSNSLEFFEKKDIEQSAISLLESNKSDDAIDLLTSALEDEPDNYRYMTLLALAYTQKHGIDPLQLAINMSSNSAVAQGNGLVSLFPYVPAATSDRISGVTKASELMAAIPSESRTNADNFKFALINVACITLLTKSLDTNQDGTLSADEIASLSATVASQIVSALAIASGSLANGTANSSAEGAQTKISSISAGIEGESGASSQDRLKSYLSR